MNDYVLKIKLKSSIITPLYSDIIFGHICWALRYLEGVNFFEDFLAEYEKDPKFLISDAFLENYLPKPILPSMKYEDILIMAKNNSNLFRSGINLSALKNNVLKISEKLKLFRSLEFIPSNIFFKFANNLNELNEKNLFLEMNKIQEEIEKDTVNFYSNKETIEVMHNQINRISFSTKDGQLYSQQETFYNEDTIFDIYFRIFDLKVMDILKKAINFISITGFGKDKSIGKGVFEIYKDFQEYKDFEKIKEIPGSFYMSLSSFVPNNNIALLFYNVKTRYGKIFDDISENNDNKKNFNPFKKPILTIEAGSIYKINNKEINSDKLLVGSFISNISSYSKIKQYAFSYPIKINISQNI